MWGAGTGGGAQLTMDDTVPLTDNDTSTARSDLREWGTLQQGSTLKVPVPDVGKTVGRVMGKEARISKKHSD